MIEERDILKLLTGEASPKKLKKLQKWSDKDPKNAADLEQYQRIFDEADHLSGYQSVDADQEFSMFQDMLSSATNSSDETSVADAVEASIIPLSQDPASPAPTVSDSSISDEKLLKYFDGLATPKDRGAVDTWLSASGKHQEEFQALNRILKESSKLKEYKKVDADQEWKAFEAVLKSGGSTSTISESAQITTPAVNTRTVHLDRTLTTTATTGQAPKEVTFVPSANPQEESSSWSWIRPLAIAASFLLLCTVGFWMWSNNSNSDHLYATYATAQDPKLINLSDGSTMHMNDNTEATYYNDYSKVNTRDIILDGKAEFDVVTMPEKPFVVKTANTGVGVTVLGTKFRFESDARFEEVIQNIEGSVRAYSLADTTVAVILEAGDRVGFDGYGFTDLNEVPYEGKDYTILYVLDYLMEDSEWRVTSAPYSRFDLDQLVNINLDQDYTMILADLLERADFDYIDLSCDGCYKITRFAAK